MGKTRNITFADYASRKGEYNYNNASTLSINQAPCAAVLRTTLLERMQHKLTHLVVVDIGRSVDIDGLVELLCLRPRNMRL